MGKFSGIILASDLDGTLLNSGLKIDGHNKRAIEYFVNNGGIFTLATGRTKKAAGAYIKELPINAPVILYNGGLIYDSETDRALKVNELDFGFMDIIRDVKALFPDIGIELYTPDEMFTVQLSEKTIEHYRNINVELKLIETSEVRAPLIKAFLAHTPERIAEAGRYFTAKYGELLSITYSSPCFLEITGKNVDKGEALRALSESLSIRPGGICAIGDSLNDFIMVKRSDISFAPQNAYEEVKREASY
ncbi:MAG: HAD-IIB family hydrolase, partial [Bacillota bacterium]|nr:HAD-IIB family hydrolase [Bacillota bacterium]